MPNFDEFLKNLKKQYSSSSENAKLLKRIEDNEDEDISLTELYRKIENDYASYMDTLENNFQVTMDERDGKLHQNPDSTLSIPPKQLLEAENILRSILQMKARSKLKNAQVHGNLTKEAAIYHEHLLHLYQYANYLLDEIREVSLIMNSFKSEEFKAEWQKPENRLAYDLFIKIFKLMQLIMDLTEKDEFIKEHIEVFRVKFQAEISDIRESVSKLIKTKSCPDSRGNLGNFFPAESKNVNFLKKLDELEASLPHQASSPRHR